MHDGVRLYYEVYGTGEPLLLVHGNGASIGWFKAQIDYFRVHYQVIALDSRDQGKSDDRRPRGAPRPPAISSAVTSHMPATKQSLDMLFGLR